MKQYDLGLKKRNRKSARKMRFMKVVLDKSIKEVQNLWHGKPFIYPLRRIHTTKVMPKRGNLVHVPKIDL